MRWIQNFIVIVLFVGALSLAFYFTVFSKEGPFAPPIKKIVVIFPQIRDIAKESPVWLQGIFIGRVDSVHNIGVDSLGKYVPLNSPTLDDKHAAIVINLYEKITFYENYSIKIITPSLLSGSVINMHAGTALLNHDTRTDINTSKEIYALNKLPVLYLQKGRLGKKNIIDYFLEQSDKKEFVFLEGNSPQELLSNAANILEENTQDIYDIIKNINETTGKLNNFSGSLGLFFSSDLLYREMYLTLKKTRTTLRDGNDRILRRDDAGPAASILNATCFLNPTACNLR